MNTAFNIQFAPMLEISWIATSGVIAAIILLLYIFKFKRMPFWRALTFAVFVIALLNPSIMEEKREPSKDVVVVIKDQSPSQNFGQRSERAQNALSYLEKELSKNEQLDLRIVETPNKDALANETLLFSALDDAFGDVPRSRRSGVIIISDGQIHDVPHNIENSDQFGPIHILLTGNDNEKDRRLVMLESPSYGIIDQAVTARYRIEDTDKAGQTHARISISNPDGQREEFVVPTEQDLTIDLPITHAGQNIFEMRVENIDGEITTANNNAALIVNGVRDRMKVLLVSGKPHAGGRTWRDLLTADPGVDLVHFTILREPSKLDATPQDELALIAFPFRELFEIKLYDFDLIIFDRYKLSRILPDHYFDNIARYVEEGGALLEASGPSFATEQSIYDTSLGRILPGSPTGEVVKKPFIPLVNDNGLTHPVTKNLPHSKDEKSLWGQWLRQVSIAPRSGDVLMTGANAKPLLILDRVGAGRVAQIASDHIWLWSRGYDGGGPHSELLRRVVHWLMKEPELDERALDVKVNGDTIILRTQDYRQKNPNIIMIKPDKTTEKITLEPTKDKVLRADITAQQLGIYAFENAQGQKRYAVVGELNPPELNDVITTDRHVSDLIKNTGGNSHWLSDNTEPKIKYLSPARSQYAGRNWIGLRANNDYTVIGIEGRQILPPLVALIILLGLTILTWWREGRDT